MNVPLGLTFAELEEQFQRVIFNSHPHALPDPLPVPIVCIAWTPSATSATSVWKEWKDRAARRAASVPGDLNWRLILAAAESALAWRAAMPKELHFWPDEERSVVPW